MTATARHRLLLLCCLGAALYGEAQNLVLNPGFEQFEKQTPPVRPCQHMRLGDDFTRTVAHWSSFSDRTPDLIRWDSTLQNCPYPPPREGRHYAGIITYLPQKDSGYDFDYHEYIQGAFSQPLTPDKHYRITFWMYQSDSVAHHHIRSVYGPRKKIYSVAAANLGICLLKDPIVPTLSVADNLAYDITLKPTFEMKKPLVTAQPGWQRVSAVFKADVPARFFVLGNFREAALTSIYSPVDLSHLPAVDAPGRKTAFYDAIRISYVCIDDVSVEEEPAGVEISQALSALRRYTFKSVLFATGSHELAPSALPELEALAAYLTQRPEQKAEIAGHTDNVGADEANRLLSERRAKAVYEYLLAQGVAPGQLSYKGYGRTRPIAPNTTEEGRRQNRRVECVLR